MTSDELLLLSMKKKIKELESRIEEWPRIGDYYYTTDSMGVYKWSNDRIDQHNRDILKIFRTKKERDDYVEALRWKAEIVSEYAEKLHIMLQRGVMIY